MADLFLDADVTDALVPLVEPKGHSVRTTPQVSRHNATDDEQLLIATDLGRLLVTHNKRDYLLLAHAWRSLSRRWGVEPGDHAGVIVIPQPAEIPLARSVAEIDNLIRAQRDLWGHLFTYDLKWGWVMLL